MQPNRLPFVLRIFLSASLLAILGCSNGSTDSDANSTAPNGSTDSDANSTAPDGNQTSSQEAPYPLDFCVVSGNDFGEHPDMIPYTHVYEGTPIKFCCKPCLPRFEKDPERYLTFMKEEIEALANEAKK